jgi:hypothetical protein
MDQNRFRTLVLMHADNSLHKAAPIVRMIRMEGRRDLLGLRPVSYNGKKVNFSRVNVMTSIPAYPSLRL